MNHRKSKLLAIISYGTLGVAFGIIVMIFFWLLYPYKTITVTQPYKVTKTVVKQGEWTTYTFDYCKYTATQPTVEKYFVDGIIFKAEYASAVTRLGCGHAVVPLHIPETLPAGTYKLKITTTYQMNPLRKIAFDRYTETFKVVK